MSHEFELPAMNAREIQTPFPNRTASVRRKMGRGRGRGRGRRRKNSPPPPPPSPPTTTEKKKPKISVEDPSSLLSSVSDAISLARSFLLHNLPFLLPSQVQALESSISTSSSSLSSLHSSVSLQTLTLEIPLPDHLFRDCFRISKASFDSLLQILAPSLQKSPNTATVSPHRKLAVALFLLAHAYSFNDVGRLFELETSVACRVFYEVCKAVNDSFVDQLRAIQSDQRRILDGFEKISLPNCCGVLGYGRFLVEKGPSGDGVVIVQALVDAEGYFLDVSAGWPGSLQPEGILYRTNLFSRVVESKDMLSGPHCYLATGDSIRQYVLGDSYCPLLPWLMTPYGEPNTEDSY